MTKRKYQIPEFIVVDGVKVKITRWDAADYLKHDPEQAVEYLSQAFETGDGELIDIALDTIERANPAWFAAAEQDHRPARSD